MENFKNYVNKAAVQGKMTAIRAAKRLGIDPTKLKGYVLDHETFNDALEWGRSNVASNELQTIVTTLMPFVKDRVPLM
jgi:hypothetical protein